MDGPDSDLTRRVWQRVTGQETKPVEENEITLMALEEQSRQSFLRLVQQIPHQQALLRTMARQCAEHIRTLRGIRRMQTQSPGSAAAAGREMATAQSTLRLLYGLCLRLQQQYSHRQPDPQFGCLYAAMAQTKARQCAVIAQMLGDF